MNQTQNMMTLLQNLSELDAAKRRLPVDAPGHAGIARQIETSRDRLPTSLLSHYDLRRSRGKSAVARVRGSVCCGCHLSVPRGLVAEIRRDEATVHLCPHCGVFLLPQDPATVEPAPPASPPAPATAAKIRRKKTAPNPA